MSEDNIKLSVRVPEGDMKSLGFLVENGDFPSINQAVNTAIRNFTYNNLGKAIENYKSKQSSHIVLNTTYK